MQLGGENGFAGANTTSPRQITFEGALANVKLPRHKSEPLVRGFRGRAVTNPRAELGSDVIRQAQPSSLQAIFESQSNFGEAVRPNRDAVPAAVQRTRRQRTSEYNRIVAWREIDSEMAIRSRQDN
jgi:hypothetical protein